jgi:hypothetical protein
MGCGCNKKKKKGSRRVSRKSTSSNSKRKTNIRKLPIISTSTLNKTVTVKK